MTRLRDLTSALRHREFRLLWSSQSLSVIGDQIITVAMALFVIDLTGSATDLGIVLAAHSLPLVCVHPRSAVSGPTGCRGIASSWSPI